MVWTGKQHLPKNRLSRKSTQNPFLANGINSIFTEEIYSHITDLSKKLNKLAIDSLSILKLTFARKKYIEPFLYHYKGVFFFFLL